MQKRTRPLLLLLLLAITALAAWYCYQEAPPLAENVVIDELLVYKSKREMHAFSKGKLIKTYYIALGRQPVGPKQFEGDMKTPEGIYTIHDKNPNSDWHKNLGISYPNAADIERARKLGKPPGGAIKIHGLGPHKGALGKLHRNRDWTFGCIAVTNEEIDELYRSVKIGAKIEIKP